MALERDAALQPAPAAATTPEVVTAASLPASRAAPSRTGGATGAPLGDDEILSLQRTAGNRAVGRAIDRGLIQRDGAAAPKTGRAQGTTD